MNERLANEKISKLLLSLAIPSILAQMVTLLYNLVDRIYIGRMEDGALAIAGIGLCSAIITIITAFTNLFGRGGAPLASISLGADENDQANKIISNCFSSLVLSSIVIMIVLYIFGEEILLLFGASANTLSYAKDYLNIYLLGTIFVQLSVGMNYFINCQGYAKFGMLTLVIGGALNIILDPIFIFTLNMGVSGAAIATVISQGLSALWVLRFLTGKKAILKLTTKCFKLKWQRVKKIIGLGLAGFIMAVTNGSVQIVCNATLKSYGGDLYVGVMTIINTIREVIMMPVTGITNGAQPVIGYNYGAKAYDRVKKAIQFMTISCILYTLLSWWLIHQFPSFFVHLFNSEIPLVEATVSSLKIYFFGFFMMAFQFAGQSTFVALGKSKQAIFFSLLRKAIIVIPLTLWLPRIRNMGVKGVFLAEPLSNFVGGLACFITMYFTVSYELKRASDDRCEVKA